MADFIPDWASAAEGSADAGIATPTQTPTPTPTAAPIQPFVPDWASAADKTGKPFVPDWSSAAQATPAPMSTPVSTPLTDRELGDGGIGPVARGINELGDLPRKIISKIPRTEEEWGELVSPHPTGGPTVLEHLNIPVPYLPREERPAKEVAASMQAQVDEPTRRFYRAAYGQEMPPVSELQADVAAAAYNAVVDTINFVNSPEGLQMTMATGGAAAFKPTVGRLVAMGFTSMAANGAIQAAIHGDLRGALESLGLTALIGGGTRHAAGREFATSKVTPRVEPLPEGMMSTEVGTGRETKFNLNIKPPEYYGPKRPAAAVVAPRAAPPFDAALDATKEDIESGKIPNVRFVAGRPTSTSKMGEALARYSYEEGQPTVTVHEGFFDLSRESKESLLHHELGHEVSRRAFMQSAETTEALRPLRLKPDDKWNYDNFAGISKDPGEMIADVYAQAMSSKKPTWEAGGKFQNFTDYVLNIADEAGLPVPEWYKPAAKPKVGLGAGAGAANVEEFMHRYQLKGASLINKGFTELGRWAREFLKEEPSAPHNQLYEIFERSKQIINDLQTAGAGTSDIQRVIRKATGQLPPVQTPEMVRPYTALKEMYRQLQAVGRAGFRRGTREERIKAREQLREARAKGQKKLREEKQKIRAKAKAKMDEALETLRTAERWLDADIHEVRKQLLSFAQHLPGKDRAKFIPAITSALKKPSAFTHDPAVIRRRAERLLNRMTEKIYDVQVRETSAEITNTLKRIEKSPTIKLETKFTARNMKNTFDALKDNMSLDMMSRMLDRAKMIEEFGHDLFTLDKVIEEAMTDAANREILAQPARKMNSKEELGPMLFRRLKAREILEHWIRNRKENGLFVPNFIQRINAAFTPIDYLMEAFDQKVNGAIYRNLKHPIDVVWNHYLDAMDGYKSRLAAITKEHKLNDENFRRIYAHAEQRQEGGVQNLLESGYKQDLIDSVKNVGGKDGLTLGERLWLREADKINSELYPFAKRVLQEKYEIEMGPKVPGYFPRRTDPDFYTELRLDDKDNPRLLNAFGRRHTRAGATIERIPGAVKKNQLHANEVMMDHIDELLYHVIVGPEVVRIGKIVDSAEFGAHVGTYGQKVFQGWVDTLARNGGMSGYKTTWWTRARRNFGSAQLGLRATTTFLQPLALLQAMPELSEKNVGKALRSTVLDWPSKAGANQAWILRNFPEVRHRVGDDWAYGARYAREWKSTKAAREAGFIGIAYFDRWSAMTVAEAAYRDFLDKRNIPFDRTAPINKEGVEYAQKIVRKTQASTAPKDLPQAISRGGEAARTFLQFQTFTMNMAAQLKQAGFQVGMNPGKQFERDNLLLAARTFGYMYLGSHMYEAGRDLINEGTAWMLGRGEEEIKRLKKERGETWGSYLVDLNRRATVNFLFVHPVAAYGWSALRYGRGSVAPLLDEGGQLTDNLIRAFTSKSPYGSAKAVVRAGQAAIGIGTGLPVGQTFDWVARWLAAQEYAHKQDAKKPKKVSEEPIEPKMKGDLEEPKMQGEL